MMIQVISIFLIALSLFAATIFAAGEQINWIGFSAAVSVLALSIFGSKFLKTRQIKNHNSVLQQNKDAFRSTIKETTKLCDKYSNSLSQNDLSELEKNFTMVLPDIEKISSVLIEQLGTAKYVELISIYAKAERKINRAVSALMDGYVNESKKYFAEAKINLNLCLENFN
jgi:hypothetical protein